MGPIKKIINKQSFLILLCVSAMIHWVIIANAHRISSIVTANLSGHIKDVNRNETTIEFLLNDDGEEDSKGYDIKGSVKDVIDILEEIEEQAEDVVEKKRLIFVDTSQSAIDEQTEIESDNVGEKGSIARDRLAGGDSINNRPNSQGDSEILSLTGGYPYVTIPAEAYDYDQMAEKDRSQQTKRHQDDGLTGLRLTETPLHKEDAGMASKDETKGFEKGGKGRKDSKGETEPTDIDGDEDEKKYAVNYNRREESQVSNSRSEIKDLRSVENPDLILKGNKGMVVTDDKVDDASMIDKGVMAEGDKEDRWEKISLSEETADGDMDKRFAHVSEADRERFLKEASKISEVYEGELSDVAHKSSPKPKVSIGINAKEGGEATSPHLYEDTLSNATLFGEPSFNIKKHEYASYYKHIRDKIALYWLLSYGTDQSIRLDTKDGLPIIVEFKVLPSGEIAGVKVVEDGGNPFLASRTMSSVKSTRLDKFPHFVKEEFIDVRFNFYFF